MTPQTILAISLKFKKRRNSFVLNTVGLLFFFCGKGTVQDNCQPCCTKIPWSFHALMPLNVLSALSGVNSLFMTSTPKAKEFIFYLGMKDNRSTHTDSDHNLFLRSFACTDTVHRSGCSTHLLSQPGRTDTLSIYTIQRF